MRKLALKVDDLQVESFEAAGPEAQAGTVLGREDASDTHCPTNCLSEPCFCPVSLAESCMVPPC